MFSYHEKGCGENEVCSGTYAIRTTAGASFEVLFADTFSKNPGRLVDDFVYDGSWFIHALLFQREEHLQAPSVSIKWAEILKIQYSGLVQNGVLLAIKLFQHVDSKPPYVKFAWQNMLWYVKYVLAFQRIREKPGNCRDTCNAHDGKDFTTALLIQKLHFHVVS